MAEGAGLSRAFRLSRGAGRAESEHRPTIALAQPEIRTHQIMKTKERFVFLECTDCRNRNYTTHKRLKSAYKLEKNKFCPFCRKHTAHKEKKL
jgi:large subunit ribosomal protein L33